MTFGGAGFAPSAVALVGGAPYGDPKSSFQA